MFPKLKLSNCLIAFFSSAFQAFGIYHVHNLADVTEGGVLGLTLLLEHWLHISPAITGAILNGACYLLGWRMLGKAFILTVYADVLLRFWIIENYMDSSRGNNQHKRYRVLQCGNTRMAWAWHGDDMQKSRGTIKETVCIILFS